MAPMFLDGSLQLPSQILRSLGEFSSIRVAAKCAARIGQSFTDTNSTVVIQEDQVFELPMVIRNGYDFGDGFGTISKELLEAVWRVYGTRRALKPTALQLRYQGYKGMVSLDPRLPGKRLMLRENMKKFEAPSANHLEICGAGFRPLPMMLNRQLIRILQDLGIPLEAFMKLQQRAVDELRVMTGNAINTSHFLEQTDSRATNVPSLIYRLWKVGLDYHQDSFLSKVVEINVITKLRDIRYRGRIPIPIDGGVTLYGIMDETCTLKENEVHVVTESGPGGGRWALVQDHVLVTRSPTMHPGDVQLVNAVDVPENSPLRQLRNVVIFSQKGARDLPSCLSGGDLDGDLYNIIWHSELVPANVHQPAQYPRVVAEPLDREVTRKDMSDFFVTFMQTDQLGMLSNIHLQLADQHDSGTLHPDCIKLAQMASTSVDFSKTGVPVNMSECPKYPRLRPDFMAPSPRAVISQQGHVDFEEDIQEDAALDDLDVDVRPMRFYTSDNILGFLYRAIDEKQFLQQIHNDHELLLSSSASASNSSLMKELLTYVKHAASGFFYHQYKAHAEEIKAGFEDSLIDLLHQHGPSAKQPATEYEAFAGCIMGRKSGMQGKALRELSKAMREQFSAVCEYTTMRIVKGDEQMAGVADLDQLFDQPGLEREVEALPRAIACLEVAIEGEEREDRDLGKLQSFKYIAAGICLEQLERI